MTDALVLITYDIHITNYPLEEIRSALRVTLAEHERTGLRATFFFPAEAAGLLRSEVRELVAAGHEVGCHGLTHRRGELYDRLSTEDQRERLRQATHDLEDVAQRPVRSFRAPAFRLSGATLAVLDELGYEADCSMNSQRLGVFSSDPGNLTWMLAPRRPYHPDARAAWRRGALKIWEIPLSCLVLPFMSKTMMIFGLRPMRWFLHLLSAEARVSGKPIVFMTHPEELLEQRETPQPRPFRWSDLLPSEYGFEFRHALVERDPVVIARLSRDLFDDIRSLEHARSMTVGQYVRHLDAGLRPLRS